MWSVPARFTRFWPWDKNWPLCCPRLCRDIHKISRVLSVLCLCGKSGRAKRHFDFQASASVAFYVIVLDSQTFSNIIEVYLQVSDSPLCGHGAERCRMNDADQHQVLQKGNAQSLSNSRTHVNIAFIYLETHKFKCYNIFGILRTFGCIVDMWYVMSH